MNKLEAHVALLLDNQQLISVLLKVALTEILDLQKIVDELKQNKIQPNNSDDFDLFYSNIL